jgi:hypothetical protein
MGRNDIYGLDDNSFAGRVSDKALAAPDIPDPIDQSAVSVASEGRRMEAELPEIADGVEPNPDVVIRHSKGDSRAKTKGNHGAQD